MIALPQAVFVQGVETSDNASGICRDTLIADTYLPTNCTAWSSFDCASFGRPGCVCTTAGDCELELDFCDFFRRSNLERMSVIVPAKEIDTGSSLGFEI